jgi:hypothetical protein
MSEAGQAATSGTEQGSYTPPERVTVGVIAPPGAASRYAQELGETLPSMLADRVDGQVHWNLDVRTDPLAGLGDESEMLNETRRITRRDGWDFGVCLTDLPIYRHAGMPRSSGRLVVADVSHQRSIAALSLPPLGVWGLRSRLRQAILRLIGELHAGAQPTQPEADSSAAGEEQEDTETPAQRQSVTVGQLMSERCTTWTVPTRRREHRTIELGIDTRFVSPAGRGHLRVWAAMVAANRPWALFHNFSIVIALAFATGAYGLIFQSVYRLTDYWGLARLIATMVASMAVMVVWFIISHHLWEPTSEHRSSLPMAELYNWITVLTLSFAILLAYAALYLLLLVAAALAVPEVYLEQTLRHPIGASRYFLLAWITASVGTVAGALGAGLETDEAVRQATFGVRQRSRLKMVQDQQSDDSGDSDQSGSHNQ